MKRVNPMGSAIPDVLRALDEHNFATYTQVRAALSKLIADPYANLSLDGKTLINEFRALLNALERER